MNQLIMIVEDEYGSAEILQLLLEAEGFRVAFAANGRDALELLDGEKPAVILSDFMMPRVTGAELGTTVRSTSSLAGIPFVIISGTNELVVRKAFKDYDAFVPKPYSVDGLIELVRYLAENGRRQSRNQQVESEVAEPNADESMKKILRKLMLPPA